MVGGQHKRNTLDCNHGPEVHASGVKVQKNGKLLVNDDPTWWYLLKACNKCHYRYLSKELGC